MPSPDGSKTRWSSKIQPQQENTMEKLTPTTAALMMGRFGHDNLIALATTDGNMPQVRTVNAYYEDGAFTSLLMRSLKKWHSLPKIPMPPSAETGLPRTASATILAGYVCPKMPSLRKNCAMRLLRGTETVTSAKMMKIL